MLRVGMLGGTFDPIHNGHLAIAEECRVRLELDHVLFVPAGMPPHKLRRPITSAGHRAAMVALAIAGNPGFVLSRIELDRPGPSFTVDTLALLAAEYQASAEPAALSLIIGMDSLADIRLWYRPADILARSTVVAVARPGQQPADLAALDAAIPGASTRVTILEGPRLDISSTDLRARVAAGLPIRYQVPDAVASYIHAHDLYAHAV